MDHLYYVVLNINNPPKAGFDVAIQLRVQIKNVIIPNIDFSTSKLLEELLVSGVQIFCLS